MTLTKNFRILISRNSQDISPNCDVMELLEHLVASLLANLVTDQPCYKMTTTCSRLVNNLEQAVRTHLVDKPWELWYMTLWLYKYNTCWFRNGSSKHNVLEKVRWETNKFGIFRSWHKFLSRYAGVEQNAQHGCISTSVAKNIAF
jgi:hypothetical protein